MKIIYCDCKNCTNCEHATFGDYYNPPECEVDFIIGESEENTENG